MKIIIIVLTVLCACMGCVKIREDMRQERIQRPIIELDSITPPDWELPPPLPPTDDPIGN